MKNILLVVLASLCSYCAMAADDYVTWWKKGNELYAQKQFDSAVYYYEKIAVQHPADEVVYYNLGNAYYRINKIGPAVLNYKRALQLNPNYQEAKDNLAITESRIANRIPVVPDIFFVSWWNALTQPSKTTLWAVASLVLFVVIFGLLWMKRVNKKQIPIQLAGILWFCWVILLAFAFFSAQNKTDSGMAVVMQNDAPLLNVLQGKTQSLVPEGTTVQLREVNGNWVEVRLPDGRGGWMQQALLSKI